MLEYAALVALPCALSDNLILVFQHPVKAVLGCRRVGNALEVEVDRPDEPVEFVTFCHGFTFYRAREAFDDRLQR